MDLDRAFTQWQQTRRRLAVSPRYPAVEKLYLSMTNAVAKRKERKVLPVVNCVVCADSRVKLQLLVRYSQDSETFVVPLLGQSTDVYRMLLDRHDASRIVFDLPTWKMLDYDVVALIEYAAYGLVASANFGHQHYAATVPCIWIFVNEKPIDVSSRVWKHYYVDDDVVNEDEYEDDDDAAEEVVIHEHICSESAQPQQEEEGADNGAHASADLDGSDAVDVTLETLHIHEGSSC